MLSKIVAIALLMQIVFQCITSEKYFAKFGDKDYDNCFNFEFEQESNGKIPVKISWKNPGKEYSSTILNLKKTDESGTYDILANNNKKVGQTITKDQGDFRKISLLDKRGKVHSVLCTIKKTKANDKEKDELKKFCNEKNLRAIGDKDC